jgi:tripartite-type tricarboxylate transporter receptor subunit TctC
LQVSTLYYHSGGAAPFEGAARTTAGGVVVTSSGDRIRRSCFDCALPLRRAAPTVFLALLSTGFHCAYAQQSSYPSKTIRLIASQSPGGGVDSVARLAASKLGEAVGQTVIVDNRAGANGSLAAELTSRSPPDGYTVMLGAAGNLGVNSYFAKLGYDPLTDLAPVTTAISSGNLLVVHPSVPAKSVKELIALARTRPGELAYGSSGTGGAGHLSGALFQSMAKINLLHVPYKGGAPAMLDLVAGQTQLAFGSLPTAIPSVNAGKLRALAVTTSVRSKMLPQLQTIAEAGVPGYEAHSWYGFVVAAKTPPSIVIRLNRELVQILNKPDTSEVLLKQGLEVWTGTPEAFGAYIRSEHGKWGRVIRAAGISAS